MTALTEIEAPATTDWVAVARAIAERHRADVPARERAGAHPEAELAALREAGLVNLLIPREFGGHGGTPIEAARVITELAFVDPNVGALLAYHFTNFIPALLDYSGDNADLQRRSARERWLWGNMTQPFVPVHAEPTGDGGYILNGTKPYNTGAPTGDISTVLAHRTDERAYVYVAVPRDRAGLSFADDWDAAGLRSTGTVTATFEDVRVAPDEVYVDSHPGRRRGFPPFFVPPGTLYFAAIQVGAARGALFAATELYLEDAQLRGVGAEEDIEATALIGRLAARVQSAVALREEVAAQVSDAWERRRALADSEIVYLKDRAEAARLYAAGVAIEVSTEIYELPGVAERAGAIDLDRFWRDARLHSLHLNPTIYHHRIIGADLLNGTGVAASIFLD
jgi:alkylation response protein AidB-like acyl-CoA dehydrogenase